MNPKFEMDLSTPKLSKDHAQEVAIDAREVQKVWRREAKARASSFLLSGAVTQGILSHHTSRT